MTAETSNARGEVVAWFPTNAQGEIIRNYGDGSPVYACRTKEEAEQAKRCHLGATGPVIPLYAAPPPAAQQKGGGDLDEVVCLACGDHIMPMGQVCHACSHPVSAPPSAPVGADGLIEAAKAAESMLRTVHECASHECEDCREYAGIVAKKLRAALAQQPEARGVVDEGSRIVTSQLLHWCGIPVRVTGTVTTSPGNWPLIDAALTEARNVR